jgi:hypothetical protein
MRITKRNFFDHIYSKKFWKYLYHKDSLYLSRTFPNIIKTPEKLNSYISYLLYSDIKSNIWKETWSIIKYCPKLICKLPRVIQKLFSLKRLDNDSLYIVSYSIGGSIKRKSEKKQSFFRFLNHVKISYTNIKKIVIDVDVNNIDEIQFYKAFYFEVEKKMSIGKYSFFRMIKEL